MQFYYIGTIIGVIIAIIVILVIVISKAKAKSDVANTWDQRMRTLTRNKNLFETKLQDEHFRVDLKISTKAYHHTAILHDIFSFCVDYQNKRIAACSFEELSFNPLIMSFDEIGSFKIIDGVSNSTSESFTSGGAVGAYGVVGGVAHTDTYKKTTLEQVKLRIDPADPIKPAVLIMMFTYRVDTSSDMYRILTDAMEQIDSVLTKIIASKKTKKK